VRVSPFWQSAITGAVIVVAVVLNAREGRRAGRPILTPHERAGGGHGAPAAAGEVRT
jgi:rhamnose transport system permease protein